MGGETARERVLPASAASRRGVGRRSGARSFGWIAAIALMAACSSEQTLPADGPEPAPTQTTAQPAQTSTQTAVPDPDIGAPPESAPTASESPNGAMSNELTDPDRSPTQTSTPTVAPSPPTPGQLVLATAQWAPQCGFAYTPPDPNPRLEVTIDLPPQIGADETVPMSIQLTNAYGETIQAESYYAVVTLTQDGEVVSDRGTPTATGEPVSLEPGAGVDLTLEYSLAATCGDAEQGQTPSPAEQVSTGIEPTPGPTASATASPGSPVNSAETSPSQPGTTAWGQLPPGTYLVGVTVHVTRDDGVVASAHATLEVTR